MWKYGCDGKKELIIRPAPPHKDRLLPAALHLLAASVNSWSALQWRVLNLETPTLSPSTWKTYGRGGVCSGGNTTHQTHFFSTQVYKMSAREKREFFLIRILFSYFKFHTICLYLDVRSAPILLSGRCSPTLFLHFTAGFLLFPVLQRWGGRRRRRRRVESVCVCGRRLCLNCEQQSNKEI